MKPPTLSEVENAFQPAKEIDVPDRFAGRREAVLECYYALIAAGSSIAIVGNRGIGKTSLARQVFHMANGNNSLLCKFGHVVTERLDFVAMYFACGDTVLNCNGLLERLLTSTDCLYDWIYDIPKARTEMDTLKPKLNIGIAAIDGELKKETESAPAVAQHSIDVVFTNVTRELAEQKLAKDGILIIIDEFDRIKDSTGFASFLKALSTNVPKVKFCIVGVAQDIQELMKEHESSDRLFAGSIVKLPAMSKEELAEIMRVAERSIDNYIVFNAEATDRVTSLAQGHPYMVHLIGKYALRYAFQEKISEITASHIDDTLHRIAERAADPVLESRYKKAVAHSQHREFILRSLAMNVREDGEVLTTDAYKTVYEAGIENPSQYVGQLVTEDYGAEIVKVRERYYRFKDSLFVAYITARPSLIKVEGQLAE